MSNKIKYNNEYNKTHYKSFSFRLNPKQEQEVITHLSKQENMKAYIVALVLADLGMINMSDCYEVIERVRENDYYSVGVAADLAGAVQILAKFVQENEPYGSFRIVHRLYDPRLRVMGGKMEN